MSPQLRAVNPFNFTKSTGQSQLESIHDDPMDLNAPLPPSFLLPPAPLERKASLSSRRVIRLNGTADHSSIRMRRKNSLMNASCNRIKMLNSQNLIMQSQVIDPTIDKQNLVQQPISSNYQFLNFTSSSTNLDYSKQLGKASLTILTKSTPLSFKLTPLRIRHLTPGKDYMSLKEEYKKLKLELEDLKTQYYTFEVNIEKNESAKKNTLELIKKIKKISAFLLIPFSTEVNVGKLALPPASPRATPNFDPSTGPSYTQIDDFKAWPSIPPLILPKAADSL